MKIVVDRNQKTDVSVEFVDKKSLKKVDSKTLKVSAFKAGKGEMVVDGNTLYVGTDGATDSEAWRVLGVQVTGKLNTMNVKNVSISVPQNCNAFVEGLQLGDYKFTYKSTTTKPKLKTISLTSKKKVGKVVESAVSKAQATCHVRDWVNTMPEVAHSASIAKAVKKMFKGSDIKVTVYDESYLTKKGMNAHLAVNRASRHEAKTIKLEYIPKNVDKNTKHHVFVGKGLTYDSGGLSIKGGDHMTTMKADKAGAMAVWGLMKYVSEFGSTSKITAYMGIAENMVGGDAYKPDDVLTAMNGKTIHVKNTDAEGRLVLFDNLCLAQKQNKDITTIHTLATLTGAAVYQFGDEAAALVGFNDKLKTKVKKAGEDAGELFMNAEFHKYMMESVTDDLADISNTGSYGMGCQKAGLFLTNAIEKKNTKKYVHWDIAGPAFAKSAFGHNPAGATGFGVRTLINFVK
jgi:leucyl aminopeptidase